MKRILTLAIALSCSYTLFAQVGVISADSLRLGNPAGTGGVALFGKTYLKNITLGSSFDSILVRNANGSIRMVPRSVLFSAFATAADLSSYQTLANLSSDLTPSATKYPSVNAVNAGIAAAIAANTVDSTRFIWNQSANAQTASMRINGNIGVEWGNSIGFTNSGQGIRNAIFATDRLFVFKDALRGPDPLSNTAGAMMHFNVDNTVDFTNTNMLQANRIVYVGLSNFAGTPPTDGILSSGESGTGPTNLPGSDLRIRAGRGTGNNTGKGNILFYTPEAGSSGGTEQAYIEKLRIARSGIGINNSNPAEALDIIGKALVSAAPTAPTGVVRKQDLEDAVAAIDLSSYQTLANLSSDLSPSATKYPSVNAVNAGIAAAVAAIDLSGKANTNGSNATGTWSINISGNAGLWGNQNFGSTETTSPTRLMAYDGTHWRPATSATLMTWLGALSSSTAAGTYQTIGNLSADLTASATKYPSVNAVNAGIAAAVAAIDLSDYLPLAGGTLSGSLSGTSASFSGNVTAANLNTSNWDTAYGWGNHASAGYATASNSMTFTNKSGNISQWTNDSGYITNSALGAYLPLAGGALTGDVTTSGRVGIGNAASNARLEVTQSTGEVFRADAASGALRIMANQTGVSLGGALDVAGASAFSSNVTLGVAAGLNLTQGDIKFISNAGFGLLSADDNRQLTVTNSGIGVTNALAVSGTMSGTSATFSGNVTSNGFVKSGGTSSQFLKADGSVDNNSYLTSSALGSYLPLAGGTLSGSLSGTSASFSGNVTANSFTGSGAGLTGTATALNIGGNAATATTWGGSNANFSVNQVSGNAAGFASYNITSAQWEYLSLANTKSALGITGGPFLPLSGGSLSGALNGTSASFSSTITAGSVDANIRLKGGNTDETDGFIGTAPNGTLYFRNWAGTRGFTINPSNVLAHTGALNVGGSGSFSGNVIPGENNTYDLGHTSYRWNYLYANSAILSGALSTSGDGAFGGNVTGANLNISNWNTAYGWGNHAGAGYMTASSTNTLTNKAGNISQWTNDAGYITSSGSVSSASRLQERPSYSYSMSALPVSYDSGITNFFVGPASGEGSWLDYGSVMNMRTYSGGGGSLQMYVPYGPGNGGNNLKVRFGNYNVSGGNSWTDWKTLANKEELGSAAYLNANASSGANTVVQRDGSGYIHNSYFNTSSGGAERNSSGLGYIAGFNSSDYYVRSYTPAALAAAMGLGSNAYSSSSYLPLSGGTLSGSLSGTSSTFSGDVSAATFSGNVASNYLNKQGNSYYQANTWIQLNGAYGLYAPSYNGAHFYPNASGSYGAWTTSGSKGSYSGIYDAYSGATYGMYDGSGNGGAYDGASGWHYYWNKSNQSLGIGGSSTQSGYRATVNGALYTAGAGYFTGTVTAPTFSGALSGNASTATSSTQFMSTSHAGSYYLVNNWDGTYWNVTSNHGSPVRVGYANTAGSVAWGNVSGAPTIPTNTNQLTNGAGFITGEADGLQSVTDRLASTTNNMYIGKGASNSTDVGSAIGLNSEYSASPTYALRWQMGAGGDMINLAYTTAIGSWQENLRVTNQDGHLTARGNITAYSDSRLKTNVQSLTSVSDALRNIRAVEYDRIDSKEHHMGFIAQEVQKYFPELIHTGTDERKTLSMAYQNFTAPLLKGWQEHDVLIQQQSSQIKQQDERIAQLERELAGLKEMIKRAEK